LWGDQRSWRQRLALAGLAALAPPLLIICFGFLDTFAHNAADFPFSLRELLAPTLALGGIVWAVGAAGLMALRGRVFDIAVSLLAGLAVAAWVEANLIGVKFGQLTGAAVDWPRYKAQALANTAIWLALLALPLALRLMGAKVWRAGVIAGPALVVAMSAAGLAGDNLGSANLWQDKTANKLVSYQGAFSLSGTQNSYFFLLDMLDQVNIEAVAAAEPGLLEANLDGFTEFENYVSRYSKTQPSAVNLLTGWDYLYDADWPAFTRQAYAESDFLHQLRQAGYSTNIYATERYSWSSPSDIEAVADNVTGGQIRIDQAVVVKGMAKLAALRYAPLVVKPSFWFDSSDFDAAAAVEAGPAPYANDDPALMALVGAEGLAVASDQPRFSYFHLNGSHPPYTMDRDGRALPAAAQGNQLDQTIGALKIVFAYLDRLRELGLYQDATIVITGDHGNFWTDADGGHLNEMSLPGPARTALLVKPAGSAGAPLAYSKAPVAGDNIRAEFLRSAGLESSEGAVSLFEVPEGAARPRTYYHRRVAGESHPVQSVEQWEVLGDAADWSNWRLVREFETPH
jgi:hypothetical protein